MRISDWSSDVCSSDLAVRLTAETAATPISAAAFAARLDPLVDPGGGPVAVAVSGGADSTALLHLADVWARERTRPLLVYTVDHRLRPEAAAEDRKSVVWGKECGSTCRSRWSPEQ